LFEVRLQREVWPLTFLRRATIALVITFLVIGAVSANRAWLQVRYLSLKASDQTLRIGSTIKTDVVSSARGPIDVQLELIQGNHTETLSVLLVRGNEFGFFDPRQRYATQTVSITSDQLMSFESGDAVLRATANGRAQWGRLPPPVVTEERVQIVQ